MSNVVEFSDGHLWLNVAGKARELWNTGVFQLFQIFEDETEAAIEEVNQLRIAIEEDNVFIEVGRVRKDEVSAKLSDECEAFILSVAPPHKASMESPTTYETVRDHKDRHGWYHVFAGGTDVENTIFSSREVQYAYRAWHDSIHMSFEIPFGMQQELAVARLQESIALDAGIGMEDAKLLRLDLEAHIEYYYASGGHHPDHQLELIQCCREFGIEHMKDAVKAGKRKFHD